MKHVTLILIAGVLAGCGGTEPAGPADPALEVVHLAPTGRPRPARPFQYMWCYRTEVRNKSGRPMRIVWFEGYTEYEGRWYANNILGRTMRGPDFSQWYTEGDRIEDGVIPAGGVAVCDVNWHGSEKPESLRTKWAFIAVDDQGNDYFVEALVPSGILKLVVTDTVQQAPAGDAPKASPGE